MNKNKFYIIIIVGLLISNLVLVFLMNPAKKHNHPRENGPKNIIIKRLGFDESQREAYLNLIEKHHAESRALEIEMIDVKGVLYEQLNQTPDKRFNDSLISVFSVKLAEMEALNLNHFYNIKNICTEDQMDDFKELTKDLNKLFSKRPPKRDRRRE